MAQVGGALNEPGLLYIIREGNSMNYKVGVSNDEESLRRRLSNLQGGNWRKLTVMHTSPVSNMNLAEQDAHNTLRGKRKKAEGGTEWFEAPIETIRDAVEAAAAEYPAPT